jgi:hypothetical protein
VSQANRASFNGNELSLYSVELEFESSLIERVSSELSSVSAHLQPYLHGEGIVKIKTQNNKTKTKITIGKHTH